MKSLTAMILLLAAFRLHALDVSSLYGTWESDPEATKEENSLLAAQVVAAMCDNLKEFPITLRFSDKEFSTETREKKVTEKYVIESNRVDLVKIIFAEPDGKPSQRGVALKGGGKTLILDTTHYSIVFRKKD